MREARGETEAALKEMIMAINSQYYLTRNEDLAEIIKICNVDIKRIKTQILRRKKKLSAEPEVPETPAAVPSAGPLNGDEEQKEKTFLLPFITSSEHAAIPSVDQELDKDGQSYHSCASSVKELVVRDRCG